MNVRFQLLYLSMLTLCLSSCFEIREEVNLKADGSGEVTWVANFSQSKTNMSRYLKMERVEGYRVPKKHEIEAVLTQVKSILGKVDGISNVNSKSDWSSYIFTISARFSNVKSLNMAVAKMSEQMEKASTQQKVQTNFFYENERFRRQFDIPAKPKEFQELPSMQRYMLETARMISIYRFDKNIVDFSNKRAQLSPSGKAIMLQVPLSELAKGTATLENTIKF